MAQNLRLLRQTGAGTTGTELQKTAKKKHLIRAHLFTCVRLSKRRHSSQATYGEKKTSKASGLSFTYAKQCIEME